MTSAAGLSHAGPSMICVLILVCLPRWMDAVRQIGYPAIWREKQDTVRKAIFLVDPSLEVTEPGILTGWNLYTVPSRRFQRLHLQIWRPNNKVTGRRRLYKLISDVLYYNDVPGLGQITLHPEDRIPLEPGDTIGIYSTGINSIPWDSVSCNVGNVHFFKYNPFHLALGSEYPFETADVSWDPCRHYSVNATVMTEAEVAKLDELAAHAGALLYSNKPYGYNQFERDLRNAASLLVDSSRLRWRLMACSILIVFFRNNFL